MDRRVDINEAMGVLRTGQALAFPGKSRIQGDSKF